MKTRGLSLPVGAPEVRGQSRVETVRVVFSQVRQVYGTLCPSQGKRQAKQRAANRTPVFARVRLARVLKASHQAKLQRTRHPIAGLGSLSADRRRGGVKISSLPLLRRTSLSPSLSLTLLGQ